MRDLLFAWYDVEIMASGDDIRADRMKKLELLKLVGMEAYPAHTDKDTDISEFLSQFEHLLASKQKVTLAGRVMSKRGQGGIVFADIFDGTPLPSASGGATGRAEKTQVVFQKSFLS